MDHETITHEDYVRYDRVWQRVAPELDPYPEARAAAAMMPVPAKEAEECCCLAQTRADVEAIRDFIHRYCPAAYCLRLYFDTGLWKFLRADGIRCRLLWRRAASAPAQDRRD